MTTMLRAAAFAVVLAAATGSAAERPALTGGETITLAIMPSVLCQECSTYTIVLHPDGRGVFTGKAGTAAKGVRMFMATPDQAWAFRDMLARVRPVGERRLDGPPLCRTMNTDQDSADVRWQAQRGPGAHLSFYAGCDMETNRALAQTLFHAADRLPVAELIGGR